MKYHAHQPRRTSLLTQVIAAGLLLVFLWVLMAYVGTL